MAGQDAGAGAEQVVSTDTAPLYLSWSKIRSHQECKMRPHLVSQGLRSKTSDIRNYFPGTVVDRCMRQYLETEPGQLPERGALPGLVDVLLDKEEATARETGDGIVKWRHLDDKAKVRDWCRELLTRLEPILWAKVIPYDYQPAVRFKAELQVPWQGGKRLVILNGEMDLLVRLPSMRRVIIDLKGTEDNGYWRKVKAQLIFYEVADFLLNGDWAVGSGLVQPMCKQPDLWWAHTDDQRREMLQIIVRVAEEIWRDEHPPSPGSHCHNCNVKAACPVYALPAGGGRVSFSR